MSLANSFPRAALASTVAALAIASLPARADVTASDFWVRGTVAQQKATGAFGKLVSTDAAKLIAVRAGSPVGHTEIHEMVMQGDVMKMQALPQGLVLPAGQAVELRPGGLHVMLMDLKAPLAADQTVDLTLVIEKADGKRQEIAVRAPVRALGAPAAAASGHGAHAPMQHAK